MHVEKKQPSGDTAQPPHGEVRLLDLLIDLAKHKKLIIGLPVIAAITAAALSFALPHYYKAGTKLLPPQQAQSSAAAVLSQLGGGLGGLAAGVAGLKSPNDLYIGILRSRTVADSMISRFQLQKAYEQNSMEKVRKTLEMNTIISSGKDGLISIEVEGKDQTLVAKLANGYVDELLRLTRVLAVTEASQRRVFYERQLEQTKNNLAAAEVRLKGGLNARGVINVDSESRALMETMARLRAQVSSKEIQLNAMQAFVTSTHPDYRRLSEEVKSLRQELSAMENGRTAGGEASTSLAGSKGGFENIQLLRDLKYYQMLYEILAKQYEIARLDEAKDPSIIQVLDPAIEPEHRFKPQRSIIVLLSALSALFAAIVWSVIVEAKCRALKTPETAARWEQLCKNLWTRPQR